MVFWGTLSFFATLVILFFGFVFLTAAVAGFLSGITGHALNTTAAGVHNLPALTEDETQEAKRLLEVLRAKRDNIEGITWYSPRQWISNCRLSLHWYEGNGKAVVTLGDSVLRRKLVIRPEVSR
jgi:hypothetical protein